MNVHTIIHVQHYKQLYLLQVADEGSFFPTIL